ncbi:acyl-CoA Delta-9 desaturase-like [Leptopilina boulardi]|uniref:acyl-CoA Delta-9 desaturase-like n=1 Tax=Leptopilina boulardi TaxID=63433 RepID=UPI0021F5836D|nr:acyl-CoA Delta-9 desaturase-like [Leptopilina boulardi]
MFASKKMEKLIFTDTAIILLFHLISLYATFTFPYYNKKATFAWLIIGYLLTALGITGGAHRLWSHSSYKAKWPVRLLLAIFFYSSAQFPLYNWVRHHRVHHKYADTNADPTNVKRGFFFAHIGWMMLETHPECVKRMKEINMNDIEADPIARFGDRYYPLTLLICAVILPSIVPVMFWNETWYWSIMSQVFIRILINGHVTASGSSLLHMWGSKPYNRNIFPANNKIMNLFTLGDGLHNYHHTFPWDYKSAEFGFYQINFITFFIESFAKIGWTYDLKEPSKELIKMTCEKKGDGTHPLWITNIPYILNN